MNVDNGIQVIDSSGNITDLNEVRDTHPTPAQEQAIVLYALGKFKTKREAALSCGLGETRFGIITNSPAGKAIINRVKAELDFRLSSLFDSYIDVIEEGLTHPDIAVRLATAKLYQSAEIGEKVNVAISAEDVVQQIMRGEYVDAKS